MSALGDFHARLKEHEQATKWYTMGAEAGLPKTSRGPLRTSTRPTLHFLLLRVLLASVSAFTLKVSHASISVECLLSMTLLLVFNLGCCLDSGEGMAAPDHPAAADWYRRAADAGHGSAAGACTRPLLSSTSAVSDTKYTLDTP